MKYFCVPVTYTQYSHESVPVVEIGIIGDIEPGRIQRARVKPPARKRRQKSLVEVRQ